MSKRKASLGLQALSDDAKGEGTAAEPKAAATDPVKQTSTDKPTSSPAKKKQPIPLYVDPLLHDALHALVFSERHKKTTFQTLFMEGLDLLLKERGLPSVEEISRGERTINP